MAEQRDDRDAGVLELPEPVAEARGRPSVVWVIPLVATLIGAWLAYKVFSERGTAVTITFRTAEGLEAGKTKVRYKALEMGVVESIELSEDLDHVVVTARMAKGTERYLTEKTRFWVVRARVSAGRVSGLGTLFSGAFIGMDPAPGGRARRRFAGLEVPPIVTTGEPGSVFVLQAPALGSLDIGSPVYYRQVEVGQVVAHALDEGGGFVAITIFVHAPHDARVRTNTRFWNASGLDVSLDADGLHVDTQSLAAMMIGGIAFDAPALSPGDAVGEHTVFPLHANRRATLAETYTIKQRYLLHFGQSVRGLVPGSPVEFRGIRIGQVTDVGLEFDGEALTVRIPVVIEVEPERIAIVGGNPTEIGERFLHLVDRGLRARLKTANLLTGQLAVELDLHPDAPPARVITEGPYPELPTIPTPLEEITASLARLVGRLEALPLEDMGRDLRGSLGALRATLDDTQKLARRLDQDLAPALTATMEEARRTLASTATLVAEDSPVREELRRALVELTEAARSVRLLAEHLEQYPESLLRGKEQASP